MAKQKPSETGSENESKPPDPRQAEIDAAMGDLLNVPPVTQPEIKEDAEEKKGAEE
jgi:hypothetical protein